MDDDFDFLRYLDFSTTSNLQQQPHSATSATFGFNSNASNASSYASPQDKSTGSSEWSVLSPSGSSASYSKSPLFGSINAIPSLFDSSFSWDALNTAGSSNIASGNSNAASSIYNAPSSYAPSQTSGNSPPFDLSIYGTSAATSNHDLGNATNAAFNANGSNGYSNAPVQDNVSSACGEISYSSSKLILLSLQSSSGLTQQWQQLLLQQAQLQLQMQLQNGNMPNANMQQPQQQQQQQQQRQQQQFPTMQVSPIPQQQAQFTMPFPQSLQPAQNVTQMQNNQQMPMQQPAQFQLSTEDWSSRVSSQVGQPQHVPLNINPTPSPNVMHGQSQSMPCRCNRILVHRMLN